MIYIKLLFFYKILIKCLIKMLLIKGKYACILLINIPSSWFFLFLPGKFHAIPPRVPVIKYFMICLHKKCLLLLEEKLRLMREYSNTFNELRKINVLIKIIHPYPYCNFSINSCVTYSSALFSVTPWEQNKSIRV